MHDRRFRRGPALISVVENTADNWSFGFGRARYVEGGLSIPGR